MKINLFKTLFASVVLVAAVSCTTPEKSVFTDTVDAISVDDYTDTIDGKPVSLYTLTGINGIGMKVTNYGARVVALCVPDSAGNPVDVAFGYNKLDDYINLPEYFFGAAIGRYGNRINDAKFTLDDVEYQLTKNEGEKQLHGGIKGYCDVVWTANQLSDSKIEFTYLSVDGEEGYPGNLDITMTYELTDDNSFKVTYSATTDKPTVCNLTHHSYFNLSGEGSESINDHILMLKSDNLTPVDSILIPTGEFMPVAGTPFDFTQPTEIGSRLGEEHQQLIFGNGYDHNWAISKETEGVETVASVVSPVTKIKMEVLTDQPGIQFYGGNFLDSKVSGKSGKPYSFRSGLCLETQHYPDSPNQPDFPSVELRPGQEYSHVCIYKFSISE